MNLSTHLQTYLDALHADGCSHRTIEQYRSKVRQCLVWMGDRPLDKRSLVEYRDHLQNRGLRPRTIRICFTALTGYLHYLKEQELISDAPDAKAIRLPRLDAPQRQTPTDREVHTMFEAVRRMPGVTYYQKFKRARARALLALLAYSGLRRSELLGLRVDDVRLEVEQPRVHIRNGKGNQQRWIPLNPEAQRILTEWLRIREEWLAEGRQLRRTVEVSEEVKEALFPYDASRAISNRSLDMFWAQLLELTDLTEKGYTPHSMRHWFATSAAREMDVATAGMLLGHSRVDTTYRYLHSDPEKMRAAVDGISRVSAPSPVAPAPRKRTALEAEPEPRRAAPVMRSRRDWPGGARRCA